VAKESELDRLDPEPVIVKLESGFPVEVVRLRTRQLFRLLRILTRGAGPAVSQLDFTGDDFGTRLFAILIMAIPDAEQETVAFLQAMAKPASLVDKKPQHMTKQDNEHNTELWGRFNEELFNPEIGDTISLLEVIVANEAPELQALGKKLSSLWSVAKTASGLGQPDEPPAAQDLHLPESSEEPTPTSSTSSAASTDGPTSTSSTSPSAASGSARRRRVPVATETS
jgi:hypothetical protein